jgi:hypothetical protein
MFFMELTEIDKKQLQVAKNLLENPGLAARITNLFGVPIEKGIELLPDNWNQNISKITQAALMQAADAAVFTMKDIPGEETSNIWHKLSVATSGGVGGFFGIAGLSVELPISTTIMLRSIADVARSEGESISSIETKMACLEVFALGGKSDADDGVESGYYAVRYALATSVTKATEFIVKTGLPQNAAPALIKFITNVAERFGVQVTQKAAAQAIPAIGAAGGAIINTLFIDHFQDMARGHFIVRKLERTYSKEKVMEIYELLPKNDQK